MNKRFIMYIIIILLIAVFGYFYLKNYAMISESHKISYKTDDIIGYINIESINLTSNLMQGLDNTFYLSHDYLGFDNENGEFFLDYQGDLLNNNHAIIYSSVNNIARYNKISVNDIIEVYYLNNKLCYKVINNNKNSDLLIKIYNGNKDVNIYSKKTTC